MTPIPDLILFRYDISVFSRKIDFYLNLRGFKYFHCDQLNRLPRPDLQRLGIAYRRIPILAIGRDIYCDTRLIIDKLERLFPENRLGSNNPFEQGLEQILSTWTQDGGPFWRTAHCIPAHVDVIQDSAWTDDRTELTGGQFGPDLVAANRPEALVHQKLYLETIEHGLLADGRAFILNTPGPSLADLQAVWTFEWLTGTSLEMGKTLEPDQISEILYPRTYAWIAGFRNVVEEARKRGDGEPKLLSSEDTIKRILDADFWEPEGLVDEIDPLKLKKGQLVEVYPIDSGSNHRDRGELVSLCTREVVILSKVSSGEGSLRLHFPRMNFRIVAVNDGERVMKHIGTGKW